jgi:hypothetical protein
MQKWGDQLTRAVRRLDRTHPSGAEMNDTHEQAFLPVSILQCTVEKWSNIPLI